MPGNNSVSLAVEKLKNNRIRFGLTPLESTPSLPVFEKVNGKIYLTFLYFTSKKLQKDEKMKIFRPNSTITVDMQTGRIVKYFAFDGFGSVGREKPIGQWPHEEIESLSLKEYKEMKEELLKKYDRAIDMFVDGIQDDEFKQEFKQLFYKICEPCLLPSMKKEGKVFFEWLDSC